MSDLTDIVTMMRKVDAFHEPSEANALLTEGAKEIEGLRAPGTRWDVVPRTQYVELQGEVIHLREKLRLALDTLASERHLTVDNIRITLCDDPARILLDRDGEGGEFSLREFAHVLHKFISERL